MPSSYLKDIFREIKISLGRFLSILCIVAIGVAFFAGIKASAPDMKNSADMYFDKYNVQDIQIYSTLGLTKKDVKAIQKLKGVKAVQPNFSMDTLSQIDSTQMVIKVISYEIDQKMNKIRVVEGRMPERENECLIEASSATNKLYGTFHIGDTIKLQSGTDEALSNSLKNTKYKIVGTCYNPNYLSYEKGSSNIGSGTVNSFIYIQNSNVLKDYYTEVDVCVKGAKELDCYSDAYFDVVDPVLKRIKKIANKQIDVRIQSYQSKLDEKKQEANDELNDAENKLNRTIANLDLVKIVPVPSKYMKTVYDFTQGFKAGASAKQIRMCLIHPLAVITPVNYEFAKLDEPSAMSEGKWVYYEESHEDVFVLARKVKAIQFAVEK